MDKKKSFETEIDFKALPKTPSRLFGWIFPYYAILFVIVGIFFVKNMDKSSFNIYPSIYSDSLEVTANVDVKKGGIMPAIDLEIISNPTADIIENGKTLYKNNCASCHGENGEGDGVAAVALNPLPRNFYDNDGWKNGREFNSIYKTLEEGIAGGGMIAYEFLPIEDRIAIIHFIRTLTDFPEINSISVAELDNTYELSKGINTPNTISLEMASDKITDEMKLIKENVSRSISKINSFPSQEIVKLFNKQVDDKTKALLVFQRDFEQLNSVDKFLERITKFPVENGFKSNTSLLPKDKIINLYRLLSQSSS